MNGNNLLKTRISYGISDFACNLIWNMFTLYLMFFYTDVVGLAGASVGMMILITRFGDSFADVCSGIIIDKTQSRWGKSRPYIFFGAFPLAVFAVLTFSVPDLSENGKLIYAYITYFGASVFYGLVNIPVSSILPSLTKDSIERVNLSTVRMVLSFLGATFVSIATLPLVGILGNGNSALGFSFTMILYCLIMIVLLYITFRNLREKYTVAAKPINVKQGFKALSKNHSWFIFAVSTIFMWASNFFVQGALIYYFTYVVGNTIQAAIVAGLINFIPLIGTVSTPVLVKCLLKRDCFLLGSTLAIIGLLVILLGEMSAIVIYIGTSIYALGHGIRQNMYFSMQADPVDYTELKEGINIAGIISAINGFMGKIAMAISAAISGFLLQWGGYIPHAEQNDLAKLVITANFIFIPVLMVIISMVIMYFYKLDKIYPEIQRQLFMKRGTK